MTERERYTTRGGFYRLTGDYRQCVKEYSELLVSYPADVAAHNNLAICLANLRDFAKAFEEVRKVVAILPNRALVPGQPGQLRELLVGLSHRGTGSEKDRGARRQRLDRARVCPGRTGTTGRRRREPTSRWESSVTTVPPLRRPASRDLASIEGRFSDAARILEQGAAQDLKFKRPDWAAAKFAALAHTELRRRRSGAAIAAGEQALIERYRLERPIHGGSSLRRSRRSQESARRSSPRWPRRFSPNLRPTRRSWRVRSR